MGMEIRSVRMMDNMSNTQREARQTDAVSKSIRSEISDVERQKQGLSSKEGMSAEEKASKRKELQRELSGLNTKLRQRQTEVRKEQQRKTRIEELGAAGDEGTKKAGAVENDAKSADKADSRVRNTDGKTPAIRDEEKKTASAQSMEKKASAVQGNDGKVSVVKDAEKAADAEKTKENRAGKTEGQSKARDKSGKELEDVPMPREKMRELLAADSEKEQQKRQEVVIARIENDIVILKGEIKQDEARGQDTEQKKAQLKRQEERVQQAYSDIPAMGEQSGPIGERVQIHVDGAQKSPEAADVTKNGGISVSVF